MKYILLVLIFSTSIFAQMENVNWTFGFKAGITFKTPDKKPIDMGGCKFEQYEGCATISSSKGNLLFYTDGVNVYNRQNNIINNEVLKGHYSSSQSAFIVKKPLSDGIYYIFTTDASDYVDPPNNGLHYSILNIYAKDTTGEFISYNNFLRSPTTEKLTATYHRNGTDVWIIAHAMFTDEFIAYLLTPSGIKDSVITNIGSIHSNSINSIGYMRVSPTQDRIALVKYNSENLELFKFDNSTGKLSNYLEIPIGTLTNYGVEFSPNSRYLYVSQRNETTNSNFIYQYYVKNHDKNEIQNSKFKVAEEGYQFGALQLGPDGKIYIARIADHLSSIDYPNLANANCKFKTNAVSFSGSCKLGLPSFFPILPNIKDLTVCQWNSTQLDCEDFMADTVLYPFSYHWEGPNSFVSTEVKPILQNIDTSMAGLYTLFLNLKIDGLDTTLVYKNNLFVIRHPNIVIDGKSEICQGDTITLNPFPFTPGMKYLWNDGTTRRTLRVWKEGQYKLLTTNINGCQDTSIFNLRVYPKPLAKIKGLKMVCSTDSTKLESEFKDSTYLYKWSTGDTVHSIFVKKSGKYWLKVYNKLGCLSLDTFEVNFINNIKIKIAGLNYICGNSPVTLTAQSNVDSLNPEFNLIWSTGEKTKSISVNKSGIYYLFVDLNGKCFSSDTLILSKIEKPTVSLNLKDTVNLCSDEVIELEIQNPNTNYSYWWMDGSTKLTKNIDKHGLYKVFVSNQNKCVDSAWVFINLLKSPKISAIKPLSISFCKNDTILIGDITPNNNYQYFWSNGAKSPTIEVTKSGIYKLFIQNNGLCKDSVTYEIYQSKNLQVIIDGNRSFCKGDSTLISLNIPTRSPDHKYNILWNNGFQGESLFISQSGWYKVFVEEIGGCVGEDSIYIQEIDFSNERLNFHDATFCEGDSVNLFIKNDNKNLQFKWNDGPSTNTRTIKTSGVYIIKITNQNLCSIYDTCRVNVISKPKVKILSNNTTYTFCHGDSIKLDAEIEGVVKDVTWWNGSKSLNTMANKSGKYWVNVSNEYGCSNSDTIEVFEKPQIDFNILSSQDTICDGDEVILTCNNDFTKYEWSNGENSKSIKVNKAGQYQLRVYDNEMCSDIRNVEIFKYNLQINLNKNEINLGNLCLGELVRDSIIIQNKNDYDVLIDKIDWEGDGKVTVPKLPIKINANKEYTLYYDYQNFKSGSDNGKIQIHFNSPCELTENIKLNSFTSFKSRLEVGDYKVKVGEEFCMMFKPTIFCSENYYKNAENFDLYFKMLYNIFKVNNLNIGLLKNQEVLGDTAIYHIQIPKNQIYEFISNGLSVCGLSLIGENHTSEIIPLDMQIDGIKSNPELIKGNLELTGCVIDLRLTKFFELAKIDELNYSDGFINLNLSSQEIGEHEISIYSLSGEKLYSYKWIQSNELTKKHENIEWNRYSNGVYFIQFRTPMGIKMSKILIN